MTDWYIARGAGLAALLLLSITTALGAMTTGRTNAAQRVLVQCAHRTTAALGLGALALHLATILADSYAHVGWLGALVPFRSAYRPGWVALGTIAAYVVLAASALGLARGRMATSAAAARRWRVWHGLAYGAWLLAVLHGLKSGTDASVGWVRLLYVACVAGVAAAVAARLTIQTGRFAAVSR